MQWEIHGERPIYENPWVNVWLVDVEQPDGHRWSITCSRPATWPWQPW